MFSVRIEIKGKNALVTVTNKDTGKSRTEQTEGLFMSAEQAGRLRADSMVKHWRTELEEPKIIEYEVDW